MWLEMSIIYDDYGGYVEFKRLFGIYGCIGGKKFILAKRLAMVSDKWQWHYRL